MEVSMKFRVVEGINLKEESNEIKRYYGGAQRDRANHNGSNINSVYLVTQFYSNLGYNDKLECHHIDPEHKGAMCVAPEGFNTAFHSYVNNLIETRFKNAPNYRADLTTLANIRDTLNNLEKVRTPSNQIDVDNCISTLNKDKGNISATTNNVLVNTDPYVKKLYQVVLRDFISGKICPPRLAKYSGKVFYKTSLEKRLGIKF
jgi:hypothetical protein